MSEWIAKPIKDGKKHLGDEYMGFCSFAERRNEND